MMIRLAHTLQYESDPNALNPPNAANVAVAIIDEPTFINKSSVLRSFLLDHLFNLEKYKAGTDGTIARSIDSQRIQLTFLMGFDTLERFLAPRYYVSSKTTANSSEDSEADMLAVLDKFFAAAPAGDNSQIVCAHRSLSSTLQTETTSKAEMTAGEVTASTIEKTLALAQTFLLNGSLTFIRLSESDASLSSSKVRARVAKGLDWKQMVAHHVENFIEEQSLYIS